MPDATPETIARNTATARRFVEQVLGMGDLAAFDEIVADAVVVNTGLKPEGPINGKAEYGAILHETLEVPFSDGEMRIDEVSPLVDGRVAVRFWAAATHTGPLWGVAATGRRIEMREIHLMRFDDAGRLIENHVGGLNPLEFEMLFAAPIAAKLAGRG